MRKQWEKTLSIEQNDFFFEYLHLKTMFIPRTGFKKNLTLLNLRVFVKVRRSENGGCFKHEQFSSSLSTLVCFHTTSMAVSLNHCHNWDANLRLNSVFVQRNLCTVRELTLLEAILKQIKSHSKLFS